MTEPIDPSAAKPQEPAPQPGAAVPAEGPAAVPAEAPAAVMPSGWIAPAAGDGGGGRGRTRGCVILIIFVGVLLVVGLIGLGFLASQARSILGGTIAFGTGGTGCSVSGSAKTFPSTTAIYSVAYLDHDTTAGQVITVAVTYPDGTTETNDETMAQAAGCVTQDISPGLTPGHYVLEYRSGGEVLANGGFDITP
jgi:hypothetical protein